MFALLDKPEKDGKFRRRRLQPGAVCLIFAAALLPVWGTGSEKGNVIGRSFELVYFTKDTHFAGRSNFRETGNRPELTTAQRIEYLRLLAVRLQQSAPHSRQPVVSNNAVSAQVSRLLPYAVPVVRKIQNLSDWKWQLDADHMAEAKWSSPEFDDQNWNETSLPLVRETSADLWFRAHVLPVASGRATLEVDAAIDECWIWVNGREVAHHAGYAPFEIEITKDLLPARKNLVAIRIPFKPGDQIGLGDRVRLVYTADQRIENIFAFTKSLRIDSAGRSDAVETVACAVENLSATPFSGRVRVVLSRWVHKEKSAEETSVEGSQAIGLNPGERKSIAIDVPIERAAVWAPGRPNLYQVHVWLANTSGAVDDAVAVTGIRTIEQRDGRLFLNDRPFFMSGFLDMMTYPPQPLINSHSLIAPSDEGIVRALLSARAAGANTIRIHPVGMRDSAATSASGWPMVTAMTDATNYARYAEIADQLGICLIWPTRFWGWQNSFWEGDKERQLAEEVPASIRLVRNHPSIIAYEGMNEVGSTLVPEDGKEKLTSQVQARVERYRKIISEYVRTVAGVDPTRLITPDSSWVRPSAGTSALEPYFSDDATFDAPNVYWDMHAYYGWYEPISQLWDVLSRVADPHFRKRPFILSEFGAEAMPDWSEYRDQPWYGVWVNMGKIPIGQIESGAIGRSLRVIRDSEYALSQAYQALLYQLGAAAVRDHEGDGMLICALADGFARGFYHKGALDVRSRGKLGWIMARMVMQDFYPNGAGSDFVFAPGDALHLRVSSISNSSVASGATLDVSVWNANHQEVDHHRLKIPDLKFGVTAPVDWQPKFRNEGFFFIEYELRGQ